MACILIGVILEVISSTFPSANPAVENRVTLLMAYTAACAFLVAHVLRKWTVSELLLFDSGSAYDRTMHECSYGKMLASSVNEEQCAVLNHCMPFCVREVVSLNRLLWRVFGDSCCHIL